MEKSRHGRQKPAGGGGGRVSRSSPSREESPDAGSTQLDRAVLDLGGDVVMTVPPASGPEGLPGVIVRLTEGDADRLVLVEGRYGGEVSLIEEDRIDEGLKQFARTSISLLERIGADADLVAMRDAPH